MNNVPVKVMMLISNGNVIAIDSGGQQVPELQISVVELWADYAQHRGYDVDGCEVRTQLPCGDGPRGKISADPLGTSFEWDNT